MAKESLLQILAIDLFVKGAYHVVKILHNIMGCVRITGYWSWTVFIIS